NRIPYKKYGPDCLLSLIFLRTHNIHGSRVLAMRIPSLLLIFPALAVAADPPKSPPPLPGEKMIQAYFQMQAKEIGDAALRDIKTKDDWEKARPELRRQLLEMLGLWPMPARTELNAKATGKL